MAQFVVRDLEESVKESLKRRAKRHGRSMEDEVRHILRNARDRGSRRASGAPASLRIFRSCEVM